MTTLRREQSKVYFKDATREVGRFEGCEDDRECS